MLPSKPKSGLSDSSNNRTPPAAANKVTKLVRAGSARSTGPSSPLQSSRILPKSVDSRPAADRRSTGTRTTPDRQIRASKGSDVPAHPSAYEEDLKKAKELLVSAQQEKAQALEELKDVKRLAEDANGKLEAALAAQKKAEESSEIATLRADESVRAGAEAARKREEEWRKELESVKKQHASDVQALRSAAEDLEKARQELGSSTEVKNNAVKVAEVNAEKAEFLLAEVNRLKSLLDSKLHDVNSEAAVVIRKLDSEVDALKQELETAKAVGDKLVVMEMLVERLSNEADDAKRAEHDSCKLTVEWKTKAETLEIQLAEAKESEKSASDSLSTLRKQLQESESEISSLRAKVGRLDQELVEASKSEESSIETFASLMKQVEEASASLQDAESESAVYRGKVESLEIELAEVKRAELEAVKKAEIIEAQLIESKQLLEERSALRTKVDSLELEVARYKQDLVDAKRLVDVDERNRLMEELATARDEEEKAKKAMEGLASALHEVSIEAREAQERLFESEDAHGQIAQLRSALKNTEENYEVMLDEARYEIVCLKKSIERLEANANESKAAVEENGTESVEVENGDLIDTENGLQSIGQEKDDELSVSLTELSASLTDASEKEYDMFPNSEEIPVENTNGGAAETHVSVKSANGNRYLDEEEPVEVEVKMLEGYKPSEKLRNLSTDMGADGEENLDDLFDDLDLKTGIGSFDRTNGDAADDVGAVSPTKQNLKKKKRQPFIHKFGSLLKKKNNHK